MSSEKLMCPELSAMDHGLTLDSLRDNWLSTGTEHGASSALVPKARLAIDKCKKIRLF